jgi:hypothetical protein
VVDPSGSSDKVRSTSLRDRLNPPPSSCLRFRSVPPSQTIPSNFLLPRADESSSFLFSSCSLRPSFLDHRAALRVSSLFACPLCSSRTSHFSPTSIFCLFELCLLPPRRVPLDGGCVGCLPSPSPLLRTVSTLLVDPAWSLPVSPTGTAHSSARTSSSTIRRQALYTDSITYELSNSPAGPTNRSSTSTTDILPSLPPQETSSTT